MKSKSIVLSLCLILLAASCGSPALKQEGNGKQTITLVSREAEKRIDVLVDGKLFTSHCWYDSVYKPILYPIIDAAGTEITRGFPLKPRTGERNDHRHQVGMWLNYGNVNGADFWGNGSTGTRSPNGGEIRHLGVEKMVSDNGVAELAVKASWIDPTGKVLLAEKTVYHFHAGDSTRIIDRVTTLTAAGETVSMKDTKEGMFAIRVARQLELPSNEDVTLLDSQGNPTLVKAMSNEGVTGNYRSSEGITGEAVWGTRARWMDLDGSIGNDPISLVVCDHPGNPNYPTYWHARGYGLFSANPLGVKDFTQGKEELDYTIPAGGSVTFRYRVIIHSGSHLTDAEINKLAGSFAETNP